MADPYVFGGAAFPYEDMAFSSQPFVGLDDGLLDSNMTYIDPTLQIAPTIPFANAWDAPMQRALKEPSKATFVTDASSQMPTRAQIRPTVGIPAMPPPHARFASPISSIEPSSSASARSPRADSESYYDSFPGTPPDTAVLSPFQTPVPLEPYSNAHAVQFTSMGPPDYVSPYDVNPSHQSEYSESDGGVIDFTVQPGYSFDSHVSEEPAPGAATPDFHAERMASPEPMRSMAEEEVQTSSRYPHLFPAKVEGDMNSEDEGRLKRQSDDDADDEYQPNKRQKPNTRTAARHVNATAPSPPPRRRRNKVANLPGDARTMPSSSPHAAKTSTLACPDCNHASFHSQPDLDAHVKKHHHLRPFNCVFDFAGCEATFSSKNEWKRHVNTQHLLLNYWVCTEGTCANARPQTSPSSPSPYPSSPAHKDGAAPPTGAIFNRKDLFTQHLKRMHAPKQVKDHVLPGTSSGTAGKKPSSSSSSSFSTTSSSSSSGGGGSRVGGIGAAASPATQTLLAEWDARLRRLQESSIRPRCPLPQTMRCPVPACGAPPFRGADAWNQRMEHVAKHMERAAQGAEPRVVFGGAADPTLVEWAARADVAIIVPAPPGSGPAEGARGSVVVLAPVAGGAAVEEEGEAEGEEIVVSQDGCGEDEDEDAEGEEDV
ncbi:5d4d9216-3e99-4ee8-a50d-24945fa4501d [Thermothielavioides terrestris]|uniref:5d4d9216-3e99-4ee8-a50d-24945fa4501d n=1 Tax=Thermothielavioides terrestris TaxID=2587410 RepID=A0A446BI26_9PEZI|nr:5d4d9216-3e99-4ee8-a50d-24945fa4501d [Thermothielavioides terrestris]